MIQSDHRDGTRLSGSRPLTATEQRVFLRHVRRLNLRNRALITAQMFLGFRISEVLALAIGHVLHHGQIRSHVALPPRLLKGKRGNTRSVPIGPELHRALEHYLAQRAGEHALSPTEPVFRSRFHGADGGSKPITRSMAEKIIKRAFGVTRSDRYGDVLVQKTAEELQAELEVQPVDDALRYNLVEKLGNAPVLDDGERDLLALALSRGRTMWCLCGPDKATLRAMHALGWADRMVSLEEMMQLVGLSAKGLEPNQTKRWLEEKRTRLKLGDTLI